jgi:hypothetical protein
MKKSVLLLLIGLALTGISRAQTEPIISEAKIWAGWRGGYFEIYNPGESAIDLSNYTLIGTFETNWSDKIDRQYWPKGLLQPKDFFILVGGGFKNVSPPGDSAGTYETQIYADHITDYFANPRDTADRMIPAINLGLLKIGAAVDGSDSLLDVVKCTTPKPRITYAVAGDPGGGKKTMIRKFSVTTGNTEWDLSRGTNKEDSEWIVMPNQTGGWYDHERIFTSIHSHMDQTESGLSGMYPGVTVDGVNKTISLPYGIRKDTIFRIFNINPNVGWKLRWAGTMEDSSHFVMRTGDSLDFYIAGNVLTMEKYKAIVSDPDVEFNKVYPIRTQLRRSETWIANNPGDWPYYWVTRYEVTGGINPIDSIQSVPWGTPVDTLFKYLEKAPKSKLDIVWQDGKEKTEVEHGDKLLVTSENGTTKEYFINVRDYSPSSNAFLAAIIIYGDSLENFSKGQSNYKMSLPGGTTEIPSVIAVPQNQNALVVAVAATSLSGSLDDRTTVIKVTAQDDSTVFSYAIEWEVVKDIPIFMGDPFIAQWFPHVYSAGRGGMSIYNPNEFSIDMSEYLMVSSMGLSLINQIKNADSTRILRPGYKLVESGEKHYFQTTPKVPMKDIIQPGKCFSMANNNSLSFKTNPDLGYKLDNGSINDGKLIIPSQGGLDASNAESFALLMVLNDSVLGGTKAVEDITPFDYEVLDMLHAFENTNNAVLADTLKLWHGLFSEERNYVMIRKPHIYVGNPESLESWGTDSASCEWDAYNYRADDDALLSWIESQFSNHSTVPITGHIPIIYSTVYIISDGSSNDEFVLGVTDNTNVEQFLANIIPADSEQKLSIAYNGVKTGTDLMTNGDSLYVTSANGENSAIYIIEVTKDGLENDASLTSTLYTVGAASIESVPFGATVETIKNNVSIAATAKLDILDSIGQIIPLEWYNSDTIMVKTIASNSVSFRVTAQDGVSIKSYQVLIDAQAGDAMVTSSSYIVEETPVKSINVVRRGVSVSTFLMNLVASPGASMQIFNKLDQERSMGGIALDDYLLVSSQDGSATNKYYLNFVGEYIPSYDASLSDLTVDATSVDGFVPSKMVYNVGLPGTATEVPIVAAVAGSEVAVVTITQAQNLTGTEAERTATVHVMAESETTENTYQVIFKLGYVPSSNGRLSDLTIDATTVAGFAPETFTYAVTLKQGTTTIPTVAGVAELDSATVAITQATKLDGTAAERTATVEVTAEDESKQSYTVVFDVVSGLDPLAVSGAQIYSYGMTIFIKTDQIVSGDKAAIFDITGKLIELRFLRSNLEEIQMNKEPGVYIVKLKNEDRIITTRVKIME